MGLCLAHGFGRHDIAGLRVRRRIAAASNLDGQQGSNRGQRSQCG